MEIDLRMGKEGDSYKYSEKEEHESKEGEGRDKRPRREDGVWWILVLSQILLGMFWSLVAFRWGGFQTLRNTEQGQS